MQARDCRDVSIPSSGGTSPPPDHIIFESAKYSRLHNVHACHLRFRTAASSSLARTAHGKGALVRSTFHSDRSTAWTMTPLASDRKASPHTMCRHLQERVVQYHTTPDALFDDIVIVKTDVVYFKSYKAT